MRLDGIQVRQARVRARPSGLPLGVAFALGAICLLGARPAQCEEGATTTGQDATAEGGSNRDSEAGPDDVSTEQEIPAATTAAAAAPATSEAHASGSLTLRYGAQEGSGNDRASARFGMDWDAGSWSGGFSASLENTDLGGAMHHEPGIGSFDLTERWIGWTREVAGTKVDARLGTAHGVRFAEGLVLGAPSFDGLQLLVSPSPRLRLWTLAGRTDVVDPEDFFIDPITLFPGDDEFLGKNGSFAAVRGEVGDDGTVVGWSVVDARADGTPDALLAAADVSFHRGRVDVTGEAAVRDGGGSAFHARADVSLADGFTLGVERRLYSRFGSPLGNAPLYTGLSPASDRDEDGWLLRMDFAPTERFSGSWSADWSRGADEATGKDAERLDHRLALSFSVAKSTAIAYGFELEDVRDGMDGQVHSLLVTHAFEGGGRLAARLSLDRSTPGTDTTLRLSWRRPLASRRLTLLVDDSVRRGGGVTENTLVVGTSLRLGKSSQLTLRATMAAGEPDSIDLTWYRRF